MNEVSTVTTHTVDGFYEPDDFSSGGSGGSFTKFDGSTQGLWFYRDGSPLSKGPYIVIHIQKELVRWADKRVAERIVQEPGEPLPDQDELNNAITKSEWEEDFNGNPKGSWQLQFAIFLINPSDGTKLTCVNSTFGQRLAYTDLKEKVQFMRSIRGERVFPLVELSSKSMKTKFGTKLRPDFKVLEWRNLGDPSGARLPKLVSEEIIDDSIPF